MPDVLEPHPVHGPKRHLATGIDPLHPENIGALVAPRIRFIDETVSVTTTYTPTRTGMRFIPLFVRAVATNPAGATTYNVRYEWLDEAGASIAITESGTIGGGSSMTLRGEWGSNIGVGLSNFGWYSTETATNFLAWPELTTADNNKGVGSIVFTELQPGNNGSTTVEMVLWEC